MVRILGFLCVAMMGTAALPTTIATADDSTDGGSSSIYRKKVGGIFWIEGTAGPSRFVPNKLVNRLPGTDDLGFDIPDIKLTGPEFGGAIGVGLGTLNLGARVRTAKYDPFRLNTVGLDMSFLIRVPFVHPYIRLGFNYHWVKGDALVLVPQDIGVPAGAMTSVKANGGGATTGLGIRIPIIKYLSIAMGVDISFVGLYIRGSASGNVGGVPFDISAEGGSLGIQTTGTFALTLHL